jgi:hypothetical protein
MRIEQDVAEAHEGAVAVEIREGEGLLVEDADESRPPPLKEQSQWPSGELVARKKKGAPSIRACSSAECGPTAGAGGGRRPTGIRSASAAAGPFLRD